MANDINGVMKPMTICISVANVMAGVAIIWL